MTKKKTAPAPEFGGALEELRARIPEAADGALDALLNACLRDAEAFILSYTNRRRLPPALRAARARLAVIHYNRAGIEGEQRHAEGSISRALYGQGGDLPESLMDELRAWRLLPAARRQGGEPHAPV
jgi:hypothetical protein